MDREIVKKVAHLARLELSESELNAITNKLTLVLQHFEAISQVNTEGVIPLVTPVDIEYRFREDVVEGDISVDEVMQNAPSRQGNLFKVPPVI
ncbi:MAG: Asp-tRNA(Asn)/Glu-tRNA(Gln) amidotransferase subunit GatC [Bdellovibrionaceae bacterium]|nr:Asp-tRNA(Asn)/Glu-tRNA(Gln) amidotransferase subunit GatC [Pseudobdellovibrionaceae bacterium]MDW8190277.1 Asp-tRNA(Asn)/Glu-tRNA(Gln) amidotransferase subunit GatC [Pseudobdellovibrionaceae bacterium]